MIALRDDHKAVGNSGLATERDFKVNVYNRDTLTYTWYLKPWKRMRYSDERLCNRTLGNTIWGEKKKNTKERQVRAVVSVDHNIREGEEEKKFKVEEVVSLTTTLNTTEVCRRTEF